MFKFEDSAEQVLLIIIIITQIIITPNAQYRMYNGVG